MLKEMADDGVIVSTTHIPLTSDDSFLHSATCLGISGLFTIAALLLTIHQVILLSFELS